ncbi:Tad domain-containing protein [Marinobacter halodurans]|nr:Tad domain-containing protein [Marinobacter halodurans]
MPGINRTRSTSHNQRGAILPLVAISLIGILGMAALALDMSHAHLEKTRLQNSLDAAALSAAKVLDQTGNTLVAETAGRDTFASNLAEPGNTTLGEALDGGSLTVTVEFSSTLDPFVPATLPAQYVRVRAAGYDVKNWFAPLFGLNRTEIPGTAVAGPSPTLANVCNVAPMMVCGTPPASAPPGTTYGYSRGDVEMLKIGSGTSSEVGNGNFYLVRLDGSAGGADVRDAAAGKYHSCLSNGEVVETEPGNTVGPFAQGINTRLGVYKGPVNASDYPPDWFTDHANYTEADYQNGTAPGFDLDWYLSKMANVDPTTPPSGVPGRRILTVPVGDCNGLANGQSSVDLLGFACFYMITEMAQTGQALFFGQFKDDCGGNGVPGPNPVTGPGPHVIQLYKDPDTLDS